MIDSSFADLLAELNQLAQLRKQWPIALIIGGVFVLLLILRGEPWWITGPVAIICVCVAGLLRWRDLVRTSVAVFYDLEADAGAAYAELHAVMDELRNANSVWVIDARGAVNDARYSAGATHVVERQPATLVTGVPEGIRSNIEVPILSAGKQLLYFFPDLLLVREGQTFGAVPYSDLQIEVGESRFIEENEVPTDALVIDRTWKYPNKNGGPDKRFKDNRELPVVLYEIITLSSTTGLNESLQVSKRGIGLKLADAVANMRGSAGCSTTVPAR